MVSKYGSFLYVPSHSEMNLVYVYNLFDAIWCSFEQKQGVLRLLAPTSSSKHHHFCIAKTGRSILTLFMADHGGYKLFAYVLAIL